MNVRKKDKKKMYNNNNNIRVDVCLYHEAQEGKSSGNNYIKKEKIKNFYTMNIKVKSYVFYIFCFVFL